VIEGTNAKQVRAWVRFQRYLGSIGLQQDPFLDNISPPQRTRIISAFAQAIREGRFADGRAHKTIKSESVRSTLDGISQVFKLVERPNPRLDRDGQFTLLLQNQLRGYSTSDPPPKPQPALTASILRQLYHMAVSDFDKALCNLFIGAFFFAMRSCEYVQVYGPRRTKLLSIKSIKFYKGRRIISILEPGFDRASSVSITFELQKKDAKGDIITQHATGDQLLCPVKTWIRIISRIMKSDKSSQESTVNFFAHQDSAIHYFSGKDLLNRIRLAAATLGEEELGFHPNSIGLHSARSGAAMAMYLAGVPVFTIMLLGRWSSDAFLHYIRKQVQEFSKGVSQKMISNERFFTISGDLPSHQKSSNHTLLSNIGSNFRDTV
jgi:hypothetical protein